MKYENYQRFIHRYVTTNPIEWYLVESRIVVKHFEKGQTILQQGDVCKELFFMDFGLARGFIIDEEGKDYTWSIYFNDNNATMTNLFAVEYDSFLHQKPSSIHIEALEKTQVLAISYDNVQFVYNKLKKGERFGRMMAEEAYSYVHTMLINRQIKSAKERFEEFVNDTPFLLQKVPQYHIATFLGITPQHLSRLKKEYKLT